MRYIVDGYNVINASDLFIASTLEGRRNKLFEFINQKRPHGSLNNSITVVFDRKSKNPFEYGDYNKAHIGDIEIIFSDGEMIADDIIAEIVDNSNNAREITVVTNDKGIHRRIGGSGALKESVESFLAKGYKRKNKQTAAKVIEADKKLDINKELEKLWIKKH